MTNKVCNQAFAWQGKGNSMSILSILGVVLIVIIVISIL